MESAKQNWSTIIKKYNKPNHAKSHFQLITTIVLYVASWILAFYAYQVSIWACVGVAMLSQVYFGRMFIIMHDCGHGSFYKSKKMRTFVGYLTGVLWFTPYWQWTKAHATHHRHSGNLDKRGIGDIWTMTTEEFEKASFGEKVFYWVCRFPPFVIFFGGLIVFFIMQRFFTKEDGKREKKSVIITNIAILAKAILISSLTSLEFYLVFEFALVYMGSSLAVLFFYVQHQYEDVYWRETQDWDFETSAMLGSSYLKIPRIVQWASGNIGYHHIHHLSHTIPNYNLEKAFKENEYFQKPYTLTLSDMIKCFNLALYDTRQKRMLTFAEYRKNRHMSPSKLKEVKVA